MIINVQRSLIIYLTICSSTMRRIIFCNRLSLRYSRIVFKFLSSDFNIREDNFLQILGMTRVFHQFTFASLFTIINMSLILHIFLILYKEKKHFIWRRITLDIIFLTRCEVSRSFSSVFNISSSSLKSITYLLRM